jgi:outer membrane protein TolC
MAARLAALLNDPSLTVMPLLPTFPDSAPPLSFLIGVAQADRAMLRAGASEVGAATTRAVLMRRDIWPDLTLGVQYAQRPGMEGTERMGSIMVGATLPVFARSRQLRLRDLARISKLCAPKPTQQSSRVTRL